MSTAERSQTASLTVNGQTATATAGETLLAVIRRLGIQVPTLCHHKAVLPYSACRLCIVEVTWGQRSKLVVSCVYEPYEGDVVETDSERVRAARRMILEFLVVRCPKVKQIRDLAKEYGATGQAFRPDPKADPAQRCILCGLCVRVCNEVVGRHAIGYADRGGQRMVSSPLGKGSPDCIGCGACVHVCPTGALHSRDVGQERTLEEWRTTLALTPCRVCGTPFATAKQLDVLKPKVPLSAELMETCPACRRQEACAGMTEMWRTEQARSQQ